MMESHEKFKQAMTYLGEIYNKEITKSLAQIYWEELNTYSDEQFNQAVRGHIRASTFFPKPAELIARMDEGSSELAAQAWGQVLKQLRDSQNAHLPEASQKVVDLLGGVEYLSGLSMKELEFKRNQFVELYATKAERQSIEFNPKAIGHE